jgi:hypothetical protein
VFVSISSEVYVSIVYQRNIRSVWPLKQGKVQNAGNHRRYIADPLDSGIGDFVHHGWAYPHTSCHCSNRDIDTAYTGTTYFVMAQCLDNPTGEV